MFDKMTSGERMSWLDGWAKAALDVLPTDTDHRGRERASMYKEVLDDAGEFVRYERAHDHQFGLGYAAQLESRRG